MKQALTGAAIALSLIFAAPAAQAQAQAPFSPLPSFLPAQGFTFFSIQVASNTIAPMVDWMGDMVGSAQKSAEIASVDCSLPEPQLPGASKVLTYWESANQTLPERFIEIPRHGRIDVVDLSAIISEEARKEGLDPLIVETIIKHESAFEPEAMSGVGAGGLMQLMPETAAELGVTDRNDPAQNVAAGTRYFAQQYRYFGNLHLALAAYNAGPGAVESYGGVPPYSETINYAASIAADYQEKAARL